MKKFSFRLDSILNYRSHLEKMAQRDVFHAQNVVIETERAIERLAARREEVGRECSVERGNGMSVPQYQIYKSYVARLDSDMVNGHGTLEEAEENVRSKKEVLRKESVKKKTLETLRDLQREKFMRRLEKEEQKMMDELVLLKKGGRA